MPLKLFPDDIIDYYNLQEKALNGYVYMELDAACTVYHKPVSWQTSFYDNAWVSMATSKYNTSPGLWKHISRPIWFNLCIDDFGFKYIGDENLNHLFAALRTETYEIVDNWVGDLFCGINLEWNYVKGLVDIAMPLYAIKNLTRYNHPPPLKPQHCPYTPNPIADGKDDQAMTPSNTSPLLDASGKKRIQQIVGSFLHYAHAVDPTILMALSAIAHNKVPQLKKPLHV
jgi:hypothetical protein